jgi:hypothetical protein
MNPLRTQRLGWSMCIFCLICLGCSDWSHHLHLSRTCLRSALSGVVARWATYRFWVLGYDGTGLECV